MALKKIRLELARSPHYPEGSADHAYEMEIPLDADGQIDEAAIGKQASGCRVWRIWPGEPNRAGALIRSGKKGWAISYEPGKEDDEALFKLDRHRFQPGDYITITDPDAGDHTFRVASIR